MATCTDIILEARALVDADSNSMPDALVLRRLNSAYEKWVGKLITLDTNWLFGDSNYTSLPTGLSNLVAGTQSYQFNSGWLTVQSVKVKDVNGDWVELTRRDLKDLEPIEEYQATNGLPSEYAVREDFILLFPAPAAADVTTTNGLQVVYQRTADVFTAAQITTGTKTPGFASPFHYLLSYEIAEPYAAQYKKDRVPFIEAKIQQLGKDLLDFYSKRDKDSTKSKTITTANISFR